MPTFEHVVVVCTGNICRSPMAEYLLRHKLDGRGPLIRSAGTGALVGRPMEPHAAALLEERGLAPGAHRARQLEAEHWEEADLLLALDRGHLEAIHARAPQARGRAFLLGKWLDDREIPDPFRQQRPAFEHALRLIDEVTDTWLRYLAH